MALRRIPVPETIAISEDGARIVLTWPGGRVTLHSALELRRNCPCAVCVDEMTGKRVLDPSRIPADVRAVRYSRVGRYAVQFTWSDGQSTGIYPYLRLYSDTEESET
ncbi:MAG TPA: DUF971 domain-containing protein [Dongiaceae bacterium]|nr:DUF971 domain-containing protein [Dongiaceae bacterium]